MRGRALRLIALVVLSLLSLASTALAEERVRVAVGDISGEGGERVRRAVVHVLLGDSDLYVVSLEHLKTAAKQRGVEPDKDGLTQIASELGVTAILEGSLKKHDDGLVCTLRVRGTGGEVSESQDFRGATRNELVRAITSDLVKDLGPALLDAGRSRENARRRVAIIAITGPKSSDVQESIEKALHASTRLELVPADDVSKLGISASAGADERKRAAAALGASALLLGEVKLKRQTATLDLSVKNGKDGENAAHVQLSGRQIKGLQRAIDENLAAKLADAVAETSVPEPPEETDPGSAEAEEEEEPTKKPSGPRPSPLDVRAEIVAFSRSFSYTDDIFNRLRAYKLGLGPALRVAGTWYPLAHFQGGPAANAGITAGYEQSIALKSQVGSGEKFSTTMREWYAGLRVRIPLGQYELGPAITYGVHSFVVDDDPIRPLVPDVRYRFVRLGVDGVGRFGKAFGGGHLGYRKVSDPGDIASDRWFPQASANGVDLGIEGGYEVVQNLDLIAGIDYRRYFYSLNPEPGDANVAGGALDQYYAGFVGALYRLPGGP